MSATTKPPPTRNRPILPDEVPDGCELVDGKLRKLPMAAVSSWVGKLMYDRLLDYSRIRESVIAFPGETAFSCFSTKPTQVRKPDVSIIAGDSATFAPP